MKKTLLSMFCALALTVPAMADQVVATFVTSDKYTGSVTDIVNFEADENPVLLNVTLPSIGDICTINLTDTWKKAIQSSSNPYLLIGKNADFTVEPAAGVTITSINFVAPSANYNVTTWEASTGEMSLANDKRWDWNGTSTEPIKFTVGASNNGPQRIMYIVVTYTKAEGGSGVASIAIDENAPVKYYNLQGMEVANPTAGTMVICKQGANTKKMIIR